jgi:YebC/PmpR family DNA-binding regulatory protein
MAGHSHYKNMARHKAIVDAKRGKLFSKLSRYIIIAARAGGGDPDTNLKLRYAIDKAREVSMPKDNIERAIKRGTGEVEGLQFEELTYEGYGPGGVALLVDVLTDNRNRTNGEVRKIFERSGGKMGSSGNVGFLFERKGLIAVDATGLDEDTLMGIVLDAGADDLKRNGGHFEVTTDAHAFGHVKTALEKASVKVDSADIAQLPKVAVDVDEETGKKLVRLMEALDDHDDVQNVYTNANLTEAMMAG